MFLLAAQPLLEDAFDSRWLVAARALVAGIVLAIFWRSYQELFEAPRTSAREWGLATCAGLAVAALWIALDSAWASSGAQARPFMPLDAAGRLDPLLLAARLVGFVVVVPVMEELFWRSFVMRWIQSRDFLALDPRRTGTAAWVVSSALFALEHHAWVAGLVAGLAYGRIYRRSGNLRACIASHSISNAALGGWILATHDWALW